MGRSLCEGVEAEAAVTVGGAAVVGVVGAVVAQQ